MWTWPRWTPPIYLLSAYLRPCHSLFLPSSFLSSMAFVTVLCPLIWRDSFNCLVHFFFRYFSFQFQLTLLCTSFFAVSFLPGYFFRFFCISIFQCPLYSHLNGKFMCIYHSMDKGDSIFYQHFLLSYCSVRSVICITWFMFLLMLRICSRQSTLRRVQIFSCLVDNMLIIFPRLTLSF